MRISLFDIDSTIPNLALMKISSYYKRGGDIVGFDIDDPDRIYISCIFKHNRNKVNSIVSLLKLQYPNAMIDIGGVGYDIHKTLPDEIEQCKPDYSLYPDIDYALGFTTRGCIRNCPFCIVRSKEGYLHRIQDIESIYDPKFNKIKLLDNNILADKDNFKHIASFCIEHKIKIDLSQGLDIRLLDDECASLLSQMKPMTTWTFAYDSERYTKQVEDGIECLKRNNVDPRGKVQFYVYCDKSDGEYGIESAIRRCEWLKAHNTNTWVMLNIDEEPTRMMKNLKRWSHRRWFYYSCSFAEYQKDWDDRHGHR